jgi:hypothetical protein
MHQGGENWPQVCIWTTHRIVHRGLSGRTEALEPELRPNATVIDMLSLAHQRDGRKHGFFLDRNAKVRLKLGKKIAELLGSVISVRLI